MTDLELTKKLLRLTRVRYQESVVKGITFLKYEDKIMFHSGTMEFDKYGLCLEGKLPLLTVFEL